MLYLLFLVRLLAKRPPQLPVALVKRVGLFLFLLTAVAHAADDARLSPVIISEDVDGERIAGHFQMLHDQSGKLTIKEVSALLANGAFTVPDTHGSTGLQAGAFWVAFSLRNPHQTEHKAMVEYVDHQLIHLKAYQTGAANVEFREIADLSLTRAFSHRSVAHNRFVFEVSVPEQSDIKLLVKLDSGGRGYVFPNLRLWSPNQLQHATTLETGLMTFLFGGFFVMAAISLVGGMATRERFFYVYSVYSLSKILAWATILGFTHQFVLTESFHWKLMSLSGAFSIFCGLWFTRTFLQTRRYTPKLDLMLRLMMANALVLSVAALFEVKALAIISITVALLLFPLNSVAGFLRWRQGSQSAGIFALAWSFLMAGLVTQALRDLGLVEHNLMNYYWPPVASYTEVIVILAAMGIKLKTMRQQKERAEKRYLHHLESSTAQLEAQVRQRTHELEQAMHAATDEARTDALTGIRNRRSFFCDAEVAVIAADNRQQPFSLLMFDLDNFKSINDTYGHLVGDKVLEAFANLIASQIREEDIFGRLGGEEFALVLGGHPDTVMSTAERLRAEVAGLAIPVENGELRVTTSVGVAHYRSGVRIEDVLHDADIALYQAKQSGRDRVMEAGLAA